MTRPAVSSARVGSRAGFGLPATILGDDTKAAPEMAAFANGVMLRLLDMSDTYRLKAGGHPSDLMAAALAAATSTALADGTDEDLRALIEQQQRQIELLQQQLDATRGVLEELSAQVESNTVASVEANEKAEILADNMENQPVNYEPATKLGGYGELHINMLENQANGESFNELDLHRFVLFLQRMYVPPYG